MTMTMGQQTKALPVRDMLDCDASGCHHRAAKVVGNTLVITVRHDGAQHTTVVTIADLLALLGNS